MQLEENTNAGIVEDKESAFAEEISANKLKPTILHQDNRKKCLESISRIFQIKYTHHRCRNTNHFKDFQ
jgi:hypothetical protein